MSLASPRARGKRHSPPSNLPEVFELKSNLFEMEWPPRSGKRVQFPEIDRAEFFPGEIARRKINPAQVAFLDRLKGKFK